MIEKSLPGNGAITEGAYQGQISDIINQADPEIDVEIEGDEPVARCV